MNGVVNVCDAAFALSKSLLLKLVLCAKCVLCCTGMLASMVVVMKGGLHWLGSPLTRATFLGHLCSAFLCSSLFAVSYGFDVYQLSRVHEDPCDYTPTAVAIWLKIIPVVGVYSGIYFMLSLAIDRTFATLHPLKFGALSHNKCFIGLIIIVVAFISLAVPVGLLVPIVDWSKMMYNTYEDTHMFQIMILFELVPEVFAIAAFHWLIYSNLRRSATTTDGYLYRRVQIESTKRVMHIVLPVVYTHLACLLLTTFGISLIPLFAGRDLTTTEWNISMECINVMEIYPCFLSLVLLYKLHLRPRELTRVQISTVLEVQHKVEHFEEFRKSLEEGKRYRKPKWYSGICC